MKKLISVLLASFIFPATAYFSWHNDQPNELELEWGQIQDQDQDQATPVPQEGAVERRDFMRTKLLYTQNIFEGLTVGEFDLINRGVTELEQILEAEQWVTIDNENYRRHVEDFRIAVTRIKKAAETKNIDATALRFYEMSTRCIDCHQHLQHAGYHY